MRLDKNASIRMIWLFTGFIFFGVGVGLVWWPSSQTIAQVRGHAQELYEEANQNDAITRRATDLRAAQARIRADLVRFAATRTQGEITAATLRLLSDEGKRLGVDVRSIAPGSAAKEREPLSGADLAIGVRGRFRNIVAFIADIPRHDILIDVHDAQMTSSDPTQGAPRLDVILHATIYRVTLAERAEEGYVPRTL